MRDMQAEHRDMHARVVEEASRLEQGLPLSRSAYLMAASIMLIDFYRGLEREGQVAAGELWARVEAAQ